MRQRILLAVRSILLGWAMLLLMVYLCERPLLNLLGGTLGGSWLPTVRLMLDCSILAGIGWVIGRLSRGSPMLAVLAFAVTLTLHDFGDLVEIRVPWLVHLTVDALRDPRYWNSLVYTAAVQTLLFASLIAGALLRRDTIFSVSVKVGPVARS